MTGEKVRQLNATGKGETDYDFSHDTLFFKVRNREYDHSIELDNIVVDIDKENFITGVQIFEAAKFLQIPKDALRSVLQWKLNAAIDENKLELRISFMAMIRNKLIEKNPIIIESLKENLPDSKMVMTALN